MDETILCLEQCQSLYEGIVHYLPYAGVAVAILLATALFGKVLAATVGGILKILGFSRPMVSVLRVGLSSVTWLFGATCALLVAFPGMTPVQALSWIAVGIVLAIFASRPMVESALVRLGMLWREPFVVGDSIQCDAVEGVVEAITPSATYVRSWEGRRATVPNRMFWKAPVVVRSGQESRRATVHCTIDHDLPVEKVSSMIKDVVATESSVDTGHDVTVVAEELTATGTIFEVSWWTGGNEEAVRESCHRVLATIRRSLSGAPSRPKRTHQSSSGTKTTKRTKKTTVRKR
jgi:small conductance mechanosensitive channel